MDLVVRNPKTGEQKIYTENELKILAATYCKEKGLRLIRWNVHFTEYQRRPCLRMIVERNDHLRTWTERTL